MRELSESYEATEGRPSQFRMLNNLRFLPKFSETDQTGSFPCEIPEGLQMLETPEEVFYGGQGSNVSSDTWRCC